MRKPNTAIEFWARVDKTGECWIWTGRVDKNGYGRFDIEGGSKTAHRLAYMFTHGSIPAGADVLHGCDMPCCVNPNHLRIGTHVENMRDKVERGRQRRGEKCVNAKLTNEQVLLIKEMGGKSIQREIARQFGISRSTVNGILNGYKWKHDLS